MREAPEQVIGRVLVPGETLLWSGAPPEGILIRPTDVLRMPLSLGLCGFALWEFAAVSSGNVFFMVWGVPFVLTGVYLLVGRFVVDAWLRTNTSYAVTDRRVIIEWALFGLNVVESLDLDRLDTMTVSERPDGRGTIVFAARPSRSGAFSPRGRLVPLGLPLPSFERIEHVGLVFDTIQRAKQGARAAASGARW
jgi:hypothetical protein